MASTISLPYLESYRNLRTLKPETPFIIDFKTKVIFRNLLLKLKKEGLITKSSNKLKITNTGKKYLEEQIKLTQTPSWFKTYQLISNPDKNVIILVMFDVPEIQRIKSDWLRFKLEEFGYRSLQRSVFWGTKLLPKDFIEDLEKYNILPYVHILSVNKKGTVSEFLKQIGEDDLAE